jgi:uroporphyrinogen decarboxylase
MTKEMTNRDKFLSVMNYGPNAKIPIVHFGYWRETIEKWRAEGYVKEGEGEREVSEKLGFDFGYGECFGGNVDLFPSFESRVTEEFPDGSKYILSHQGVVELHKPGLVSIPSEIDHTLKDRASWEKHYLPRLRFDEKRYGNWDAQCAPLRVSERSDPLGFWSGCLYGNIRTWFGIVGLSYIAADDPELYDEVIETVGNLTYETVKYGLEKCSAMGVTFDFMHMWEDICYNNGPLVNPAVFAEKVGPFYKKIIDLGKEHGIKIFSLDCDGKIDALLPVWFENGVNTMFPIEVGTWEASIKPWREKYGRGLLGVGGMDKRVFARDKAAVDAEIIRLKGLTELGGYIPCPDHRIAPDAEYGLVRYYCERMREVFG